MGGWSRTKAIHEAGHAVAFLVQGIRVERVTVYMKHGEKRARGSVNGRCHVPERTSSIRQEVIALYAGPIAEARHKGCSLTACLIGGLGPGGDWTEIEVLLAGLPDTEQERAQQECEAAARVIVEERWVDIWRSRTSWCGTATSSSPHSIQGS